MQLNYARNEVFMIYLGEIQKLQVGKLTDNGAYLFDSNIQTSNRVLLPKNQLPEGLKLHDMIEVFIYRDSEDRLIATTTHPLLTLGKVARLKVKELSNIGAFLDWGLAKDLLLPFKEQTFRPKVNDSVLVALYIDKSNRLCATMKVYNYLKTDSPYHKEERVHGMVYDVLATFGAFVAVDDQYSALIPNSELFRPIHAGEYVDARITKVQEDGKLNLSIREKAYAQMDQDAELILDALKKSPNGYLPYHDKSDPDEIRKVFQLSKNSFKRAIGRLLKEEKISLNDTGITIRNFK